MLFFGRNFRFAAAVGGLALAITFIQDPPDYGTRIHPTNVDVFDH